MKVFLVPAGEFISSATFSRNNNSGRLSGDFLYQVDVAPNDLSSLVLGEAAVQQTSNYGPALAEDIRSRVAVSDPFAQA
jgi:hypothetical protein